MAVSKTDADIVRFCALQLAAELGEHLQCLQRGVDSLECSSSYAAAAFISTRGLSGRLLAPPQQEP
jgi:hypothetical protein